MDHASSTFLLSLHRAARRMAHRHFRPWVFAELGRCLRFDSGFWLRMVVTPTGPQMHDHHLDRQRPDRVTGYLEQELWREDPFVQAALSRPAGSFRMAVTELPQGRLRSFLEARQQQHVVAATDVNSTSGVVIGISVFRRRASDPFDDAELSFIEGVGPHIIDAWTHNWLQDLGARGGESLPPDSGLGVLTAQQVLTATDDDGFACLMHREWPEWRGPALPAPLATHLQQWPDEAWTGRNVVARFERVRDGLVLLRLRARHVLDELSPRKREVARLFAGGATQAEVAGQMTLSTSTVNNYLVEIYRHLEVSDKAQLALVVARLPP